LTCFVRMLATLKFWSKRVAIVSSRSPFARAVAEGIEQACRERRARRRGVRVKLKYTGAFDPETTPEMLFAGLRRTRVNALLSAGSYAQDVAMMRLIIASGLNIPVLGCVAAGVDRFAADMGEEAAGIVGPSQWGGQVRITPQLGPAAAQVARPHRAAHHRPGCDHPAARAHAARPPTRA